jgi:alginate O-acetyltransferase complex protein AlgI
MVVCTVLVFQPMQAHDWALTPVTWRRIAVIVPLFLLALMAMYTQAFNPFLYFQF